MTATLPVRVRPAALQDILASEEPYRTHWVQEFLEEYDYKHGGTVKLQMKSGRGKKVMMDNGEVINIVPRGTTVAREAALQILLDYGYAGTYHGIDRATGVSESAWRAMHPETKKTFEGYEFNFNNDYVIHVPWNDLPPALADALQEVIPDDTGEETDNA